MAMPVLTGRKASRLHDFPSTGTRSQTARQPAGCFGPGRLPEADLTEARKAAIDSAAMDADRVAVFSGSLYRDSKEYSPQKGQKR